MLMLNGESVPPGMASRLGALSLRLEAMGFPAIGVSSGVRSKATQEAIFRARYLPVAAAGGRNPYNDKRYWQGQWWVRVNPGGTVLPPGSSTHEDPPGTGVDLAWPYNNRYTAAHAALVSISEEYGIRWTGKNFVGGGEDWHFDDFWNPYATFASTGAIDFNPLEDIMAKLDDDDRNWLSAWFKSIRDLLLVPNASYGFPEATLHEVQALAPLVRDTQNRVRGGDPRGDMLQLIMEKLGVPLTVDIDEAALAKELAPLLPAQMSALSTEDVQRIANASADVLRDRLASP